MNDFDELPESFKAMFEGAPEFLTRKSLAKLSGGAIAPETLRNLDHMKRGPEKRVKIRKYVAYPRREAIYWLWKYLFKITN